MNETATMLSSEEYAKNRARKQVVDVLSQSQAYQGLPLSDQQALYFSMMDECIQKERDNLGLESPAKVARSLATDSGGDMGYKGYDPGFQGDTAAFKDLVDSVDFPKFVADLLKAVFDANLTVMKQQTDSYIKLMKEATKSSADFIKQIKDDDTFAKLAESRSEKYNVTTEKQPDGSMKLALTNPEGEKADLEDAQVKAHILEAKINMAKEHRAALREVLLMGVTRLVVEKGEVEAGVDFTIHANRESKAHHEDQNVNVANLQTGFGGGLGSLFGGPSASLDVTNTNIQINTSDKKTTDDLSANLHGKVNIKFKTDYFKLDNFASMYADGGVAALKPPGGAPGQPALPPAR
jgi:hypothetical protein